MQRIAIVGAGLMGRLIALRLAESGQHLTLIDQDSNDGKLSCAYAAAGMLAPFCELDGGSSAFAELGLASLKMWREIFSGTQQKGTIALAHAQDRAELHRFRDSLKRRGAGDKHMREINHVEIDKLEPELGDRFSSALYLPDEGHLDNRVMLQELAQKLNHHKVEWVENKSIDNLSEFNSYDWIIDARGLGAQRELGDLRGVRGELVYLHAPDVKLTRPIRLMHPRYPVYIVPRDNHVYVVGATCIESEDKSPISARSLLELLSAATSVHPGFMQASVIETVVGVRPAFKNHEPRIEVNKRLIHVNGLYRHGYLLGPVLADAIGNIVENKEVSCTLSSMVKRMS